MKITKIFKVIVGQDLVEYALMAGFVAVAAGAIMPGVSQSIAHIFAKITLSACKARAGNDVGAVAACNAEFVATKRLHGIE